MNTDARLKWDTAWRNEYRSAVEDPGWQLAVFTRATTAPKVTIFTAEDVRAVATPYVYRADLST